MPVTYIWLGVVVTPGYSWTSFIKLTQCVFVGAMIRWRLVCCEVWCIGCVCILCHGVSMSHDGVNCEPPWHTPSFAVMWCRLMACLFARGKCSPCFCLCQADANIMCETSLPLPWTLFMAPYIFALNFSGTTWWGLGLVIAFITDDYIICVCLSITDDSVTMRSNN